jgi:C4-dicarboxylate-specific signal transduction histidine kinase
MNKPYRQGTSLHDFRKVIIRILIVWFFLDFFMSWRFGWRLTLTSEMFEVKGYRDFASAVENNYQHFFLEKLRNDEPISAEDKAKAFKSLLNQYMNQQSIQYQLISDHSTKDSLGIAAPADTLQYRLLAQLKARDYSEFPYYERIGSGGDMVLKVVMPLCLLGEDSLLKNSGIDNCILMQMVTPVVTSMQRDPLYSVAYLGSIVLMLIMQGLFIEFYISRVGTTYSELKNLNKTLDKKVLERTEELESASRELSDVMTKLEATEKQRIAQEKMASIGLLASGIAHEIGNPLNFINNFADINKEILHELRAEMDEVTLTENEKNKMKVMIDAIDNAMQQIINHGKGTQVVVQQLQQHSLEIISQKEGQ